MDRFTDKFHSLHHFNAVLEISRRLGWNLVVGYDNIQLTKNNSTDTKIVLFNNPEYAFYFLNGYDTCLKDTKQPTQTKE